MHCALFCDQLHILMCNAVQDHRQSDESSLCTVPQTVATFTNYMFGATAFSMPYALAIGGWAVLFAMGIIGVVCTTTSHLLDATIVTLAEAAETQGLAPPLTYSSVVRRALGRNAQKVLVVAQYMSLFMWAAGFILASLSSTLSILLA